jgi:hypothetical protein
VSSRINPVGARALFAQYSSKSDQRGENMTKAKICPLV